MSAEPQLSEALKCCFRNTASSPVNKEQNMSRARQNAQDYWNERSSLFSNYYEEPSLFDKIFRKGIYTRIAVALDTAKALPEPTVLDVGSGPGINSIAILRNTDTKHLTGIDFAPNMIAHSKEIAEREGLADRCTFIEGDFLKRDFDEESFDMCMALGVLDYVGDAQAFVAKMNALSKTTFVISWPENGLRMMLRKRRYDCPVYHYEEADILRLHKYCGIHDVRLIKYDGGWASIAVCE